MKLNRTPYFALLLVLVSVLLAACGGKPAGPEQVAENFIDAARSGDTATVTQLVTAEMKMFVGDLVDGFRSNIPADTEIRIVLNETVGNTARLAAQFDVSTADVLKGGQTVGFLSAGYAYPSSRFNAYTPELKKILNSEAYEALTVDDYMIGWNFVSILQGIASAEGEPLQTIADEELTEETLNRWLNNPPTLDQNAIENIETIAAEIATITEGTIDISGYREQLRPHLDTIGEYLTYQSFLRRAGNDIDIAVDPQRKSYVTSIPLTLHKVDDKWLVAPGS